MGTGHLLAVGALISEPEYQVADLGKKKGEIGVKKAFGGLTDVN